MYVFIRIERKKTFNLSALHTSIKCFKSLYIKPLKARKVKVFNEICTYSQKRGKKNDLTLWLSSNKGFQKGKNFPFVCRKTTQRPQRKFPPKETKNRYMPNWKRYKSELRENQNHTNRKPHKTTARPPPRRLFIPHARVWPIKHSTRQCDGNQSRLKGVPYTTRCSLKEQLVSQSKRISECTEKWVLPLLLWYVSFWLTIFKSNQSFQGPGVSSWNGVWFVILVG